jgi:hypothetical protein
MVNMEIVLEKELELERQGFRRTRRWIGDASRVADPKWYQTKINKVLEIRGNLEETSPVVESKPRQETLRSTLTRFLNLPPTRHQPAKSKA